MRSGLHPCSAVKSYIHRALVLALVAAVAKGGSVVVDIFPE